MSTNEAAVRRMPFLLGGAPAARARRVKLLLLVAAVAVGLKLVGGFAVALAFGHALEPIPVAPAAGVADSAGTAVPAEAAAEAEADDAELETLRKEVRKLETALAARAPRRAYIVIDRYNNRLWLRRGGEVQLEAVVSTGSGTVLKESGGAERVWTFDTPPGRFEVLSERRNPVWTKPDWAFLEEGQEPPKSLAERREKGSLGEWALDLGDGYMIHGTLYERLLGRNITHGCVRVGRDDLRVVAQAANPGTQVYIF